MKYDRVLIFTKKGNLMQYLCTERVSRGFSNGNAESIKRHYGEEREIQLIACLRWEETSELTDVGHRVCHQSRCMCKIKCPVNPLPVKGEFELPSLDSLRAFLKADGWTLKQDVCANLFK